MRSDKIIEFIELLKLTKSHKGKPFILEDWQKQIIRDAFDNPDIREIFLMLPKKNGKTAIMAALSLFWAIGSGEKRSGEEIIMVASCASQSRLMFDAAAEYIRQDDNLKKIFRIYTGSKTIEFPKLSNKIRCLASDADSVHGVNPSRVLYDELHAIKSQTMFGLLKNSMSTRQPEDTTWISATHAGHDKGGLAYQQYDYACKVRDGLIEDKHFLPVIYAASPKDDWNDENVWRKVNPAQFIHLESLRSAYKQGLEIPRAEADFRMYALNEWCSTAIRWLNMDSWKKCKKINVKELEGKHCFCGLDLGNTSDFNAFCLYFPDTNAVLPYFWIPAETAKRNPEWVRWGEIDKKTGQSYITITDGSTSDYDKIFFDICDIARDYNIRKLLTDEWQSNDIALRLRREGLDVEKFAQTMRRFSPPSKKLEKLVLDGELKHNNHPVLQWMAGNTQVISDNNDNIRPVRPKDKSKKIDGLIALCMAIAPSIPDIGNEKISRRGVIF